MTDWESLYKLVSAVHIVLVSVTYGAVFAYFSMPFVKQKKHAFAAGTAYFVMLTVLWNIPVAMNNVAAYGLSALAGLLVLCAFDRKRFLQKIFLSMTFFSVRWLVMAIGSCLYIWMYKMSMEMPNFSGNEVLQFRLYVIILVVNDLVDIVLLFTVAWIIKKAYRYRDEDMRKNEFALLMLPSMWGLVGYAMHKFYDYNYQWDTGYGMSEVFAQLMSLCYYAVSLGTIIVMIVLYQSIQEKQEEIRQKELLNAQIESMKHHIEKVERLYMEIRGLRHDMGNHITTLEALYETGERVSAGAYMEALKRTLCESDSEIKSGNPVTDLILSERRQESEEKGIVFVCDFRYPDSEKINAFDISVILNNALDNAIRAAEQIAGTGVRREIRVHSYVRNDIYLLEIENSFDGEQKAREKTNEEHGYGLLNIKRVSQKYCGDMTIECAGGVFKLSVMLVQ